MPWERSDIALRATATLEQAGSLVAESAIWTSRRERYRRGAREAHAGSRPGRQTRSETSAFRWRRSSRRSPCNRDFGYLPEFVNYSGLSARVGSEITEVVVGAANRSTANVGERGAVADETVGLPITRMSVAVISDPIGRFSSGWCELDLGRHHLPHPSGDADGPRLHDRLRPEAPQGHEAAREVPHGDGRALVLRVHDALSLSVTAVT